MFNRSELRLALMLPTMTANSSTLRNHAEIQRNIADLQHQTQDPYVAEPALENKKVSDLDDEEILFDFNKELIIFLLFKYF
jgi:hypothetical protein